MTVAVIMLAGAVVAAIAAFVWVIHREDVRVDQVLAARDALDKTREELMRAEVDRERAEFERRQVEQALASERARAAALEDYVRSNAMDEDPGSRLAPDDVAGHVLRISRTWAVLSNGAGGPLPPGSGGQLRPGGPSAPPGADVSK